MTPVMLEMLMSQPPWMRSDYLRAVGRLAALYDASDRASMVIDGSNRVSLIADKSGNSEVNCWCNGNSTVSGQSMTAANKSVTGSQNITLNIGMDSYRPSADRTVVDKLSGNNGLQVLVLTTGVVRLRVGDGSSVTNVDSTSALANTKFSKTEIGIAWTDGVGASFTQDGAALGTAVSAAKTLTNAAVSITIGQMLGRIYRAQVGSVYDCNPSLASKMAGSFSSGGDTWTVNSSGDLGARISGERDLVQLTASKQPIYTASCTYLTFDGTDDYMKAAAFGMSQPESVYFVGQQVSWTINDRFFDGNTASSGELFQETATPTLRLFAGGSSLTTSALAVGTNGVITGVLNGASSALRVNRGGAGTANIGTASMNGLTLGAAATPAAYANIRVNAVAIYSAAHATATQDDIIRHLGKHFGIFV